MVRLLVLGGRFAGLTAAYTAKRLLGDSIDVTLINDTPYSAFRPNMLHVGIGIAKAEDYEVDLNSALTAKGINFILGRVTGVDAKSNKVSYSTKDTEDEAIEYDYLVFALGAKLGIEHIKGWNEYGASACEPELAKALYARLEKFEGGNIAIGSGLFYQGTLTPRGNYPKNWSTKIDSACEGPVFELSLMIPPFLKKKGVLDKTHITIFSPGEEILTDISKESRNIVKTMYSNQGFDMVWNFKIKEIDKDKIISDDGKEIKADLAIILPPYEANDVVKNSTSDLFDDGGFMVTDEHMRSLNYPNVYSCGDSNQMTVPKLGALATQTARIAMQDLANRLGVPTKIDSYAPDIICIADNPLENTAISIDDTTLYGGDKSIVQASPANHIKKELFAKYFMWTNGDMVLDKYLGSG
ncbi:sulfide:quinone oxidoreductase [Candidatus Mancarchaeum acidiphilum]|uniref:Sulfide:quinone oxidoreductase n=1 Tax=Candidatus Mancarchaeum acidiphilum TaxID=1920749 RepID=A0A218NLX2_9ARCH|nr:FAD-dependent oxidoreductase [Candidatus Mancarchaeum acidiphilum]ASI13451.1 sulfide:quinone oxidoreductase [Candidatus Mancarchaeum acidiphilum]